MEPNFKLFSKTALCILKRENKQCITCLKLDSFLTILDIFDFSSPTGNCGKHRATAPPFLVSVAIGGKHTM